MQSEKTDWSEPLTVVVDASQHGWATKWIRCAAALSHANRSPGSSTSIFSGELCVRPPRPGAAADVESSDVAFFGFFAFFGPPASFSARRLVGTLPE